MSNFHTLLPRLKAIWWYIIATSQFPFVCLFGICFETLFVFSCFWEFLEQQAFIFSDTSLGLNILQTYLSMIEVLFFTGSYTKSSSLLLCLPSDELKSKSCSISTWIHAIISKFHSLAKQTVLLQATNGI